MFRVFLVLVILAIGYDAVVHQGFYTRNIWTNLVSLTESAVSGAKQLGENAREENRSQPDQQNSPQPR